MLERYRGSESLRKYLRNPGSFEATGWRAFLLVLAGAAAAILFWLALEPITNPDRHFIALLPPTIVVTLFAGARCGILTAALAGAIVWYEFLPPEGSIVLSRADAVAVCTYVLSTAIAVSLVYWLRATLARENLLRGELEHRAQNLFAVVHGLALQTFRGDAKLVAARDSFLLRLKALGKTNARLKDHDWTGVELAELVDAALEPFSDQFQCRGPKVHLRPQTAQNISLVLHELATNASKYGGLSQPQAGVSVSWTRSSPDGGLNFEWKEHGGPRVEAPSRAGFGTKLLKTMFGSGEVEFAPDGLAYRLAIPESAILSELEQSQSRAA